ncbi:MAG: AmmeMemoRadiSam system radical SAM enzyme [Chloroflexi bacterium]|nr:AmmeMemoRadiSam system radical SAM enzyme [Chloroflexota bacterium]
MKEAMLYSREEDQRVLCHLCAQRCHIADGKRGFCGVRENRKGTLYSLVYGKLIAQAIDPIEKKPLFHFYPGSTALSIATVGCNFRCTFCQNADISQMVLQRERIGGEDVPPEAVVQMAQRYNCRSIAYTYTEPTISFEFNYDCGKLAHEAGIANIYVTNGYMTPEMLDMVGKPGEPPLIDAANVDLKSFRDEFYRQQCKASLQPVLDSLIMMKRLGIWLEVTTLVIPGLNDSDEELRQIARFLVDNLGSETPWHVSRFHPTYKLVDRPSTPVARLHRAREIGMEEGLQFVYEGNVPGGEGESTKCPACDAMAIRRLGFSIRERNVEEGQCRCGYKLPGVGM